MSSREEPSTWPAEIRLDKNKSELTVTFDDGRRYVLSAELLRVMSPSAEVQGHSPEQRVTVPGKRRVKIRDLRPVGNYALQILFDDGHDTGYYRWDYLHDLGEKQDFYWGQYLSELEAKGLGRD